MHLILPRTTTKKYTKRNNEKSNRGDKIEMLKKNSMH